MAQVSERLERGDPQMGVRLERAIEDLASRFEQSRAQDHAAAHEAAREALRDVVASLPQPGRDEETAREIADLREMHEVSDVRSQQTLSAVHETLEKVVDRLAMLEDDVIETRAAQAEQAAAVHAPARSFRETSFRDAQDDMPSQEQPAAFAPAAKAFKNDSVRDFEANPLLDKPAETHFHADEFLWSPAPAVLRNAQPGRGWPNTMWTTTRITTGITTSPRMETWTKSTRGDHPVPPRPGGDAEQAGPGQLHRRGAADAGRARGG